jgi:hypothetical protein
MKQAFDKFLAKLQLIYIHDQKYIIKLQKECFQNIKEAIWNRKNSYKQNIARSGQNE